MILITGEMGFIGIHIARRFPDNEKSKFTERDVVKKAGLEDLLHDNQRRKS